MLWKYLKEKASGGMGWLVVLKIRGLTKGKASVPECLLDLNTRKGSDTFSGTNVIELL